MQKEQAARNNKRFTELHSRYAGVSASEYENNKEYVEYRLQMINDPASRAYVQSVEMDHIGFELVE